MMTNTVVLTVLTQYTEIAGSGHFLETFLESWIPRNSRDQFFTVVGERKQHKEHNRIEKERKGEWWVQT